MKIDMSQLVTADDKAAAEQERRRAGVNAERDRRLAAGVAVSVSGYGDIPVQGRPGDQINLIALADTAREMQAASVTTPIPFRDAGNAMHNLTTAQVLELSRKGKEHAQAIYATSWAMKDNGEIPADYADDARWP